MSEPAKNIDKRIPAAIVLGAHGLKGQVRLRILLENPLLLRNTLLPTTPSGEHPLVILDLKLEPGKGSALATLKNVTDRTQAEALQGTTLYIPRSNLPPLSTGEVYLHDLVGRAIAKPHASGPIGSVTGLAGISADQTLLEITLLNPAQPAINTGLAQAAPAGPKRVLVPAHADFFDDLSADPLVLTDLGTQLVDL